MFWPFILLLPKKTLFHLFLGICIFFLLLALKSLADIGALVVGVSVIAGRKIGGRRAGMLLAVIAAPSLIKISGAGLFATPSGINNESLGITSSSRHRLAMWSFATEKIDEKLWLGWGFDASRHIPQEDRRLAPNMEIMPLHPHNLALQTRLELGLPGSLILAGLVFSIFYRLATFTNDGWVNGLVMAPAVGWLFRCQRVL
jgi:O-antigen ligase